MIKRIQKSLANNGIGDYLITGNRNETIELFFIKKEIDMRRMKDVTKYTVTVYKDFDKAGKPMRGSATTYLYSSMTDEEMDEIIKDAALSASYVNNPYYELPEGTSAEKILVRSNLSNYSLVESAKKMTKALFEEDTDEEAFINSAELFVTKQTKEIVSSRGSQVSFEKYNVQGEFITQCKKPQDVERYNDFYYEDLNEEGLKRKVKEALAYTKARAIAKSGPKAGNYKVILSGNEVKTLLSYYLERSSVNMIYPQHSNFKVGEYVQGQNISGDLIQMTLKADVPYTEEGIPKKDHVLMENGVLKTVHGSHQLAYYMKEPSIGTFNSIQVEAGSVAFEDMKQGEYLHIVAFSDFQMDATTGYFGGEIRLAFYSDGEKVVPVTGGSLSGQIKDNQEHLYLSKEMQIEKGYEGPFAICLNHVNIAGV